METRESNKQTELKEASQWKKLLFGTPWWGLTVLLLGIATVCSALAELSLAYGISAIAGLFSIVGGLLVVCCVLAFLTSVACIACRLSGTAKSISKPKNSRLVKYGASAFGIGILIFTINISLIAVPNVQANTWTAKPLVNHDVLWIEKPASWELQESDHQTQHYYDAARDLTVLITVVSKQDMATVSLKQLSQNNVEALHSSFKDIKVVHEEELIRDGKSRLLTELQGEGANRMLLHFVLNHIDLGDHWLEIRFVAFPSQIEAARDTIKRFTNSLHTRS